MNAPYYIKFFLYIIFAFIKQCLYIKSMTEIKTAKIKTKWVILTRLKHMGAQTAPALAKYLGLTPMAVRQHLYDLAAEDQVDFTERKAGRGRPAKHWDITQKAQKIFPDAHQGLAVDLLTSIKQAFGQQGLNRIVDTHSQKQLDNYTSRLKGVDNLPDRLQQLAEIRTEEGYMASIGTDGRDWYLSENHCPICAAATTCTKLCANELDIFQQILGPDVHIERDEHIIKGARRCRYRITPAPYESKIKVDR